MVSEQEHAMRYLLATVFVLVCTDVIGGGG